MNNPVLLLVILAFFLFTFPAQAAQFYDVPASHWAKESIDFMVEKGVINVNDFNSFHPDDPITRAELTVMAYKLFDKTRPNYAAKYSQQIKSFEDVPTDYWAYTEIMAMYDTSARGGIVGEGPPDFSRYGSSDYERWYFFPDEFTTRLEGALLLGSLFTVEYDFEQKVFGTISMISDLKKVEWSTNGYYFADPDDRFDNEFRYHIYDGGKIMMHNGDWRKALDLHWLVKNNVVRLYEGKLEGDELMTRAEAAVILHRMYNVLQLKGMLPKATTK